MSSGGVVVRFVRNCKDFRSLDLMEKANLAVREVDADSVWFAEADCMKLMKSEKNVFYVFGSFYGEAFHRVKSLGNRVYGSPCILECLRKHENLPKQAHPVYSISMKGIVLSCTGLQTELRNDVHEKVEWMMGETSRVVNEKVNYLIAGEVGSKKYLVAAFKKAKIMLPEWVENVWQESQFNEVHASDAQFNKYRCPIFKGLSICASGLNVNERLEIKKLVEEEGGKFSGMMKINECTHLIIKEASGQKYQFAKEWKIHTIRPEWIDCCMEAGFCLEESKYLLSDGTKSNNRTTSTPNNKKNYECNVSSVSNLSSISVTHINETECTMKFDTISHLHSQQASDTLPCLDDLNVYQPRSDCYLNGCKIFLCGAALENSERIRILINKGNGMRFSKLNETISHVVAEVLEESLIRGLQKLPHEPHVVSLPWLIECFKQGRCVSESPFSLLHSKPPSNEQFSPHVKSAKSSNTRNDSTLTSKCAPATSGKPGTCSDMTTMLSQYMPTNTEFQNCTESGESAMMRAAELEEGNGRDDGSHLASKNKSLSLRQDYLTFEDQQADAENEKIFSGLTFVIFHLEFLDELTKEIKTYGGEVLPLNTRKVVNIGVVPVEGCPVTSTVNEVVTTAWVNMCIEESNLFPFDFLEIFRPITILPNCQPLKGCVLSISGLLSMEKSIIVDILKLLGGKVQDCFVRVQKENFLACTHLVANSPDGSKYGAAIKWGIPVVAKRWAFECARTGKRAAESEHSLQKIQKNFPQKVFGNNNNMSVNNHNSPSKSILHRKSTATASANTLKDVSSDTLVSNNRTPTTSLTKQAENKSPMKRPSSVKNSRVETLIRDGKKLFASPSKSSQSDTPSRFLNAKEYQPRFNFQNSLNSLQSPALEVKHSNKRMSINSTSGEAQDNSFSQENPDAQARVIQADAKKPLVGVVISVAKKLIKNQTEYNKLAVGLGAQYRWMYQSECTHFIFQGKQNDANREFRTAKEQGKIIVSPHWLVACDEQQKKVGEDLYPHTYNSNMSLNVTGGKTPARTQRNLLKELPAPPTSEEFKENPPLENESTNLVVPTTSVENHDGLENSIDQNRALQTKVILNGLKKLNEATRSSDRSSWKGRNPPGVTSSAETHEVNTNLTRFSKHREEAIHPVEVGEVNINRGKQESTYTQASQVVEVMWDDPLARKHMEKLSGSSDHLAAIKINSKPAKNLQDGECPPPHKTNKLAGNGTPSGHEFNRTTHKKSEVASKKQTENYIFMLSGFKPHERDGFVSTVESLGGSIIEGPADQCSHLIAYNPSRSEKFLACVSTGKWVLHKTYLIACEKERCFVEEENYEWGSENILKTSSDLRPQEQKLAVAARTWRLKLQEKDGAFAGWKCLLLTDLKKAEGFSRLLKSGGASIIPNEQSCNLKEMTHVFIETKNLSVQIDLEKMVSMGIHCLKPEYISNFLTDQPQPEPVQFYIPEALRLHTGGSTRKRQTGSPVVLQGSKKNKRL